MLSVNSMGSNYNCLFDCAVYNRDIVENALSRAKRRPAPVSPSRSCSTTLKYFPCSRDV